MPAPLPGAPPIDASPTIGSMRTLGLGSNQAVPGDKPSLTAAAGGIPLANGSGVIDFAWLPTITQDQILPAFNISMSGAQTLEVGQTVVHPAFTASYNRTPAAAVLTDDQGTAAQDVIGTPTSFSSTGTFTKNTYGAAALFTLTANETGGPSRTSSVGFNWLQKVYHGAAVVGTYNAAFIQALTTGTLASNRNVTYTDNATSGKYLYYAARSAYGTPVFTVGVISGGFSLVAAGVSVTNAHGFTENYDLWRSDNISLGSTTVTVS